MAVLIIQTTDFTGPYTISTDLNTVTVLQRCIDDHEKNYIRKLLGKTTGDLFIADVDAVTHLPVTAKYLTIFNALQYEDAAGCLKLSRGIKEYLVAAIFYHFVSEGMTVHGQSGVVSPNAEAATRQSLVNQLRHAEARFNMILDSAWAIQEYCALQVPTDYPDYNGQDIEAVYSSIF